MNKKCIVCSEPAVYFIKDTNNYYCEDCAKENFSDLDLLVKVEDLAKKLKNRLEELTKEIQDQK